MKLDLFFIMNYVMSIREGFIIHDSTIFEKLWVVVGHNKSLSVKD